MSQNHWGTEADVLKDLEEVYGMRVKNIHRDFFIHGQGPPPPMITDEDDQQKPFEDRHDSIAPPDLKGITQMLQIVKEHEEDHFDNTTSNGGTNTNYIITISKLNPNAADFTPQSTINKNCDLKKDMCIPKDNVSLGTNKSDTIKDSKQIKLDANDNGLNINKTDPQITNKERELFAEQLKNKICCNAKADTFQAKREKNLAISSLLKLYTRPASPHVDKKPKLITPDYFTTSKVETLNPGEVVPNKDSDTKEIVTKLDTTEESSTKDTTIKMPDVLNYEIENSIKKVNNWLNPSPKPKALYLGKFAFKRKEPSCMSPNSISDKTPSKSSSTTAEYKPSKYAEELALKFELRQKNKVKVLDPMDKLVVELKSRDEEIRRRAVDKVSANRLN